MFLKCCPPRLRFQADALLLFLRALIPNKMATRPIKNPVVAAYINIASAMMYILHVNYYAL